MNNECVFCRVISGELPADVVYQDEELIAFRDIRPQAPTHILIVPKTHIPSLNELKDEQQGLLGRIILIAKDLANREDVAFRGYRLTANCGSEGGQLIPHLHFHLLGGRQLSDRLG